MVSVLGLNAVCPKLVSVPTLVPTISKAAFVNDIGNNIVLFEVVTYVYPHCRQWGYAEYHSASTLTVMYPITFPNTVASINTLLKECNYNSYSDTVFFSVFNVTKASFDVRLDTTCAYKYWIAIGY